MKRRRKGRLGRVALSLALALGVSPACSTLPASSGASDVNATLAGLIAADNAGDIDAIVSFYAPDAVLLPPSEPPVQGRAEIRKRYETGFDQFTLDVGLETAETRETGEWAFSRGVTRGRYVWRDGSPATLLEDKYLMILKRNATRQWEVAVLMWSPMASDRQRLNATDSNEQAP